MFISNKDNISYLLKKYKRIKKTNLEFPAL